MVLVLHGYGDQPERLLRLMARIDTARHYSWLAPYGPGEAAVGGPAWFPAGDREGSEMATSLARIDETLRRRGAGAGSFPEPVVVVGHSQGAAMGLALACRGEAPWRPSAVIAIAGFLPNEPGVEWDLPAAAGTRFLLAHGSSDDVVSVQMGRSAARALERAGAEVEWYEHPGGHELTRGILDASREWLARPPFEPPGRGDGGVG